MCFGCGEENPRGLKLRFKIDPDRSRIRTRWTPSKEFQGYADIVHGGIIGLILDELMVNLLWSLGRPSVTAELTVRFLRPARVGDPIDFEGWITSEKEAGKRIVYKMESAAREPAGRVVAEAAATCVRVRGS